MECSLDAITSIRGNGISVVQIGCGGGQLKDQLIHLRVNSGRGPAIGNELILIFLQKSQEERERLIKLKRNIDSIESIIILQHLTFPLYFK